MSAWLQKQLQVAENLLEAVDRTVSAAAGANASPSPPRRDSADDQESASRGWEQLSAPAGTSYQTGTIPITSSPYGKSSAPPSRVTPPRLGGAPADDQGFTMASGPPAFTLATGPPPFGSPAGSPEKPPAARAPKAPPTGDRVSPLRPTAPAAARAPKVPVVAAGAGGSTLPARQPAPEALAAPAHQQLAAPEAAAAASTADTAAPSDAEGTAAAAESPPAAVSTAEEAPQAQAAASGMDGEASGSTPHPAALPHEPTARSAGSDGAAAPTSSAVDGPDQPQPASQALDVAAVAEPGPKEPQEPAAAPESAHMPPSVPPPAPASTSGSGSGGALAAQLPQQPAASTPAAARSADASGGVGAAAREAQLQRLVDTLRKRLDVVRGENQQLEDLLHGAEDKAGAATAHGQAMAAQLAAAREELAALAANTEADAAAHDAQVSRLRSDLEVATRQVAGLQESLAMAQEAHQELAAAQDSLEGGMLEALRSELSSAEARLESERKAHHSTKAAAASREHDLEQQLQEGSQALSSMQRALDEGASRLHGLESQLALLHAANAQLEQQVAAGADHPEGAPGRNSSQLQQEAELAALHAQLDSAHRELHTAQASARSTDAEAASLRQQLAEAQEAAAAAAAGRSAPALEAQLREASEMLYQKQAQLERLAADRAAQQMLLERQIAGLQHELQKAHAAMQASSTGAGSGGYGGGGGRSAGHDIIPMDALGEPYQRLARHNRLGGAVTATAEFLDSTAARGLHMARQYPLARLIVFAYIILIHLYLYFLIARMQRQALMMHHVVPSGGAVGAGAGDATAAVVDVHAGKLP